MGGSLQAHVQIGASVHPIRSEPAVRHIVAAPRYRGGKATYPAPAGFDKALSRKKVEAAVAATGFIKG